jgi:hypothetical protein
VNHVHRALFSFCMAVVLPAPLCAQSPVAVDTLEQLDGDTAKPGEAIAKSC